MSAGPDQSVKSPPSFRGLDWARYAPPWLNTLANWLLGNLLAWALAGMSWVLINRGDKHQMATNFFFLASVFTAGVYGIALVVYQIKRKSLPSSH